MRRKITYSEHFVNNSSLQKLYNLYVRQSIFDKMLDILVFFAIFFTILGLILELTLEVNSQIIVLVHKLSFFILLVFAIELLREYAKSSSGRHFLKKHWIDLILVSMLSLFFLFSYLGIAKMVGFNSIKTYIQEAKHTRVIFQLFKR